MPFISLIFVTFPLKIKRFVLCNGKEIIIFDVDENEPLLYFKFADALEKDWERLYELLSPDAFINPSIFNYKRDFGLLCIENGMKPNELQIFFNCRMCSSDAGTHLLLHDLSKYDSPWGCFSAIC